ncbi:MAG: CopG family antitoxin [Thermomicrobiales bacterium]
MSQESGVRSRIPEFQSVEEAAEFWGTHSTAEFEDEWEPVDVEVSPNLGHVLSVRLDRSTFRRLSGIARQKGVGASTLARMWVLETLDREDAPHGVQTKNGSASG